MQDSFARVFALMDTLKTIGLYDQAGERISPSGDLKEFSLFTFDGASIGYNKCLQTVKFTQGLAAYAGASNSGFFDEGVIDYTNKCTDFISRFETEFASLDAKYQLEKGKLQEAIQRLQSLKEDYPTAYAKVDDNLKSRVEAKLTEWNVSDYAEVGRVYANADFSICDELQQAIVPILGVAEITVSYKRKGIFDLNGRPINVKDSRELMPGIYIVDGKKVVVK